MRCSSFRLFVFLMLSTTIALAQSTSSTSQTPPSPHTSSSGSAPLQQSPASTPAGTKSLPNAPNPVVPQATIPISKRQPKRILGIMPNYRAISAGTILPPPTKKEDFMIATENSFDYSAFTFVAITSLLAEASNTHPPLRKGIAGYGRYYWRGFIDKTDANYLVDYVFPIALREDERYYMKGDGGFLSRTIYASTRVLITPNYHGHNTFNGAEILGTGIAQAVSLTYYPSQDQAPGAFMSKYVYALGRDALTNVFREFWPSIAAHMHLQDQ